MGFRQELPQPLTAFVSAASSAGMQSGLNRYRLDWLAPNGMDGLVGMGPAAVAKQQQAACASGCPFTAHRTHGCARTTQTTYISSRHTKTNLVTLSTTRTNAPQHLLLRQSRYTCSLCFTSISTVCCTLPAGWLCAPSVNLSTSQPPSPPSLPAHLGVHS